MIFKEIPFGVVLTCFSDRLNLALFYQVYLYQASRYPMNPCWASFFQMCHRPNEGLCRNLYLV